jgi:hypothetical protein
LRGGQKLLGAEVLAAQRAVNVKGAELDALDVVFLEEAAKLAQLHQRATDTDFIAKN